MKIECLKSGILLTDASIIADLKGVQILLPFYCRKMPYGRQNGGK